MLINKVKNKIIKKFQVHESDTGSTPVQIAILTEEIKNLVDHLKLHKKDHSSRLGLLKKIGERRKLLHYLEREDEKLFEDVVKKLKLKISKKFEKRRELLEDEPLIIQEDEEGVAAVTSSKK